MPKPKADQEQFLDIPFPTAGVDLAHGFEEQVPLSTRLGVNVRTFEGMTQRGRGGSRPGIAKYIAGQVPSGPHKIQCIDYVVDPAAAALLDSAPDWAGDLTQDPGEPGWWFRTGGTGVQPNRNRKRTPYIIWNDPADINQGTALSGTQLNAAAFDPLTNLSVAGSFAYDPPSGTVLPTGDHQALKTVFTPTDTAHYRTAKATVHINVKNPSGAFVQAHQGSDTYSAPAGGNHVITQAFTADVTIGNLLIAVVSGFGGGGAISMPATVTDNLGNTYAQGLLGNTTTNALYWCISGFAGPCTVSATVTNGFASVNSSVAQLAVLEYHLATTPSLDATATQYSGPYAWSSGPITVAATGKILIGFFLQGTANHAPGQPIPDHPNLTPGTGFAQRVLLRTDYYPDSTDFPDLQECNVLFVIDHIGLSGTLTDATDAMPIVLTSVGHNLATGDKVTVTGVVGNTAANVTNNAITVVDTDHFSLDGTIGNGVYVSGGTWKVTSKEVAATSEALSTGANADSSGVSFKGP